MSIVQSAVEEMRRAKFPDDDIKVMGKILRQFFDQWDSGGACSVMIPVINRLLCGQPLGPLTGDDGEWNDVSDHSFGQEERDIGYRMYQNRRSSSVFKRVSPSGDTFCYDINLPRTNNQFTPVVFPYDPVAVPPNPVMEVTIRD